MSAGNVEQAIRVAAAVIERDSTVLIARRAPGKQHAAKWEFPGGKIEAQESPEECLKRELREEFGVDVDVGEFVCRAFCDYETFSIELLSYRAVLISGDFVLSDHDRVLWAPIAELEQYDFSRADLVTVRFLLESRLAQ